MAEPTERGRANGDETGESPPPNGTPPRLDLSTVIEEAVPIEDDGYFLLDGERYTFANVSSWGLRQRHQYQTVMDRIEKLGRVSSQRKNGPSEADEKEYRSLMVQGAGMVAPTVPADILKRLDDGQLMDIMLAFFVWIGERHPRMATMMRLANLGQRMGLQIGSASSPASSVSTTPETPSRG